MIFVVDAIPCGGDVRAAHARNRPVGQVVVEQDEVRTIPSTVRTSFSSKLTSSSISGPEIPPTDSSPFKSGEPTVHLYSDCSMMALIVAMFSVALVACGFQGGWNPRSRAANAGHGLEQGGKFVQCLLATLLKPAGKGWHPPHQPSNLRLGHLRCRNRDGDFFPLCLHPSRNLLALFFERLVVVSQVHLQSSARSIDGF